MKIAGKDLAAMHAVLSEYAGRESRSVRFSFKLGHAVAVIEPHVEQLRKLQREVYLKYVEKDEAGEPLMEDNEPVFHDVDKLEAELNELFDTAIEIAPDPSFTIGDFEAAGIIPTGAEAIALQKIVVIEQ